MKHDLDENRMARRITVVPLIAAAVAEHASRRSDASGFKAAEGFALS
jgi:hypothetical protein